jgi:hypothetical protein
MKSDLAGNLLTQVRSKLEADSSFFGVANSV